MGSMRDEKASEVGSSEKTTIIRPARGGQEIASLDPESKTPRPLGITDKTWPGAGMEQEEPQSCLLGLSVGSEQNFWQESAHGRDCRGQFLGSQSRTEKDEERMGTWQRWGDKERRLASPDHI